MTVTAIVDRMALPSPHAYYFLKLMTHDASWLFSNTLCLRCHGTDVVAGGKRHLENKKHQNYILQKTFRRIGMCNWRSFVSFSPVKVHTNSFLINV